MLQRATRTAALTAAGLLVALAPSSAQAIIVQPPAGECPPQATSEAFAPWGDGAQYTLLPDGGFEEGAAAWRLSRGVAVVDDNEPWHRRGAGDRRALALRAGGSAVSPPLCIGIGHPTLRLFARNTGSPLGLLSVEILATTSLGLTLPIPIGVVSRLRSSSWAPTHRMLTLVNLLTILPPGVTEVSFRFRAIGLDSSWVIDDVYVDPYAKR
jgi:hypothetical protein